MLLALATVFPVFAHPLKMSVANLSYDESRERYELDLRMYIDDFLVVSGILEHESQYRPSLTSVPSKSVVAAYVEENFKISINDVALDLEVHRIKFEELTIYVTFKIKDIVKPGNIDTIEVKDSIFVDRFVNQRNVIHVEIPGVRRRSLLFNKYQQEGILTFD